MMMSKSSARRTTVAKAPRRSVLSGAELISVVVPSIGRETLAETVTHLLAQSYSDIEVLVVDNRPDSGRVHHVLESVDDPRLSVLAEPVPGVSAARNAGIRAARGALIAFTDDDATPAPDWVEALVTTFVADETRTLFGVTGRVVGADIQTSEQEWFEEAGVFDKGVVPLVWSVGDSPLTGVLGEAPDASLFFPYTCGEVGSGNNLCVHRDAIALAGDFDEVLGAGRPTRGGEDLDLIRRILQTGATILYQPTAVVAHHHRADAASLREQMFGYGVGMSAVLTKLMLTGSLIPVARRIPAGMRYLLSSDSERNETRSDDAGSRSLIAIEFAGYLLGPVLYLRTWLGSLRRR